MLNLLLLKSITGVMAMFALGLSFHSRKPSLAWFAPLGWILAGLHFGLATPYYIEIADPTLVVMSALAPVAGVLLAIHEIRGHLSSHTPAHTKWLRGMVFWAGTPYLLIAQVPHLNRLATIFIAWQTIMYMRWTGSGDIAMGEVWIKSTDGPGQEVAWTAWEGNKWWLMQPLPENGLFVDLIGAGGESVGINFVLACTAIQSIIVFVGAIVAVNVDWKTKIRALVIVIPLINILNVFRNAGIIWMHMRYPDWSWAGLSIFEFGHSYASKFLSLLAMFLMALVLFEIMPRLHRNVLGVIDAGLSIFKRGEGKPSF